MAGTSEVTGIKNLWCDDVGSMQLCWCFSFSVFGCRGVSGSGTEGELRFSGTSVCVCFASDSFSS